jgi:hypothetical protein
MAAIYGIGWRKQNNLSKDQDNQDLISHYKSLADILLGKDIFRIWPDAELHAARLEGILQDFDKESAEKIKQKLKEHQSGKQNIQGDHNRLRERTIRFSRTFALDAKDHCLESHT